MTDNTNGEDSYGSYGSDTDYGEDSYGSEEVYGEDSYTDYYDKVSKDPEAR